MTIKVSKLKGEPTHDRLCELGGRKWRVRVVAQSKIAATAPASGDVELAPSVVGVSISVAALDDGLNVAKDKDGNLLIFDAHVLTIQAEQQQREDFDPEKIIAEQISQRVELAAKELAGREKLGDALRVWE